MKYLFILYLAATMLGCTKKSTSFQARSDYKEIAKKVLNADPTEFSVNESGDYVLALHNENRSGVAGKDILDFVVISMKSDEVITSNSIPNGNVKWISNYEIEIYRPPGIPKDETEMAGDYKSIYNVKTGEKTNKKGASY